MAHRPSIARLLALAPPTLGRGVLLLALVCWGGAFSSALDGLNHFAPFWLVFSVAALAFCVAAGAQARGWAAFCAVAVIAQIGIIAPEFVRSGAGHAAPAQAGQQVRVIWLNTWLGGRGSEDVLRYLEASGADFLLVSELHDEGQPEYQRLRELYPTVIRCQGEHECNTTIYARRTPVAQSTPAGLRVAIGEFDIDGAPLRLIAAHAARPNPPGRQQRELAALAGIITDGDTENCILGGDFNSTPWSFTLRHFDQASELQRHTRAMPTWPAQEWTRFRLSALFAFLPIDHMYSGARWRLVSLRRGPRTSSDHFPIEATFQAR
ncbi:MAG: endonuclease/exonuclease/phosphatase family protein [Terricaulis sp.]